MKHIKLKTKTNKKLNLLKNKKGFEYDVIITVFYRLIITFFVGFFLIILVKTYIVTSVETFEIESELFIYNLVYSQNGISYYDETLERLHPGMIDIQKFSDASLIHKQLETAFNYSNIPTIAANLTLKNTDGSIYLYNNVEVKSVVYHETWYNRWIVLVKSLLPGKGSAKEKTKQMYVLVKDESGAAQDAVLEISVIIPSS